MECEALLDLVVKAANERGFHVKTVVSNDDTTMKKIMRHDYKKMINEGEMETKDWPLNDDGNKLTSGRLPSHIPSPKFLADFNHRVKSVGKGIYELATVSKKISMVNKDLAKRMKYYWS